MKTRLGRRALLAQAALIGAGAGIRSPRFGQARQEPAFREPTGPSDPPGGDIPGGTITIGSTLEPVSLFPWNPGSAAGYDVLDGVMEGLLRYNAAGRLQPALAEGFTLEEDGTSYRFKLRTGVRFHNGDPFGANDLIAGWQVRQSGVWGQLPARGWDLITAIDVPEPDTVIFRTGAPYAPFLSTVATTPVLPLATFSGDPAAALEAATRAPIGTGPFRIAAWEPGVRIRLERWEEYYGGPARLDAIERVIAPDVPALVAGLANGAFDIVGAAGGIPATAIDAALALPNVSVWNHVTPNWLHIDIKQIGFLRERAVRQALDFATPRNRIIDEVYAGRAIPAFADQMPGSWAYHPSLQPRPFSQERATALLQEAGFRAGSDGILARDGEPFRLELWGVTGDESAAAVLELVAASWSDLGVDVLVRTAPADQLWGPMGYQFSGSMTACLYTWSNTNDPDDVFYWNSSQIPTSPTAAGGNLPAYFQPYAAQSLFDLLTNLGVETLDVADRTNVYREIQELLAREVPVIFLCWEEVFPVSQTNIAGFWPNPYTGLLWNAHDWRRVDPNAPASTPLATPGATPVAPG